MVSSSPILADAVPGGTILLATVIILAVVVVAAVAVLVCMNTWLRSR